MCRRRTPCDHLRHPQKYYFSYPFDHKVILCESVISKYTEKNQRKKKYDINESEKKNTVNCYHAKDPRKVNNEKQAVMPVCDGYPRPSHEDKSTTELHVPKEKKIRKLINIR